MQTSKFVPRVIVEWKEGVNSKPRFFSLADTYEEANELEAMVRRAIEQELANKKKSKRGGN